MEEIRILLGKMPPLVHDLLRYVIRCQTDMQIVRADLNTSLGLSWAVKETGAHVVLEVLSEPQQTPADYERLLHEFPKVVVIALSLTDESSVLYHRPVKPKEVITSQVDSILKLIRSPDVHEA